ncbi:Vps5-domain-containing protein [Dichomitus squalens]|uniref:Vps5-domain-containing protein n=1 Tax=Dichomitus squalens TaxID=114155 RepID=A0A4Q9NSG2_9APHY|nr:Vps5-domain-containing protein [Dichomitus squalens]TBU42831.1 Vps5-domain-containing protein [Dichomitus squalens]TBU53223.1 Vps5-domain-containing protein [Dichomitus squalens]
MDNGFDDLLAPSRDVMDNPFGDPFAQGRSSSPDPWASFGTAAAVPSFNEESLAFGGNSISPTTLTHNAFADVGGFQDHEPQDYQSHDYGSEEPPHTQVDENKPHEEEAPASPADPLDTAAFNAAEAVAEAEEAAAAAASTGLPTGLPTYQSRGFRESISTETDEPVKLAEPEPRRSPTPPAEQRQPPLPKPSSPPPPPERRTDVPAPSRTLGHGSRASTASFSSSHKVEPASFNPLDQPASSLNRSIAGLSIGGEALGGWQSPGGGWQTQTSYSVPGPAVSAAQNQNVSDDDDDDDRPIAETMAARAARSASPSTSVSTPAAAKRENGIQPVFVITVDDPQRVGDPIRAYTMYTVHTKTTSPMYKKSSFSVLRRYSDFLWLYETLSLNNPGVVVPPVPDKNPFARFDEDFVQQRRLALEKCIQKIANHPVLQKDHDLKLFLESDTFALDIKHRKAELAQEKGGLMAALGQTIAGPRFYETDEWFDRQKAYLDSLETQLRGLVKAIDAVAKQRAEVSAAAAEFAQAIADLAACDVGSQLAVTLSGLADVERKAQELQNIQASEDVMTVLATADEYARLINSVRLAFSSRVRIYHAWQSADAHLRRTKQTHESNRAQGRLGPDQLSRSLAIVGEAERRALDAKQEFDHVSRLVKSEVARFEQERIEDFKNALEAFLEGMIKRQKQLIASWESYQQSLLKRFAPQSQQRPPDSPVSVSAS